MFLVTTVIQLVTLSFLLAGVTATEHEGSSHLRRHLSVNFDPKTIELKRGDENVPKKRKFVSYHSSRWEQIW